MTPVFGSKVTWRDKSMSSGSGPAFWRGRGQHGPGLTGGGSEAKRGTG